MNPQEDPEARIRDLERPLADLARTSELGTGQYDGGYGNVPPPLPQPGYSPSPYYGAPYAGTSPRVSGGFSWWWFLLATFVVGGLVVGVGFVVLETKLFSSGGSTSDSPRERPNFSGGGGTLTNAPSGLPGIPSVEIQVPTAAPIAEPSVTVLSPGVMHSVSGLGNHETIACNDGVVSVSGMENTVVITGHCATLNVSGVDNEITVDSAESITASGFDNRITYHFGTPVINSSDRNVVEQG